MGLEFIDRVNRLSIVVGGVLFVFLTPHFPASELLGLAAGLSLSVCNLLAWRQMVKLLASSERASYWRAVAFVKIPLICGAAFLLVRWTAPVPFAVGFSLPLAVIVLKAAGQVLYAQPFPMRDPRHGR